MAFGKAETSALSGAHSEEHAGEITDSVLVARVQDGDASAFNALIRKYRERLFGVIYNLTSNREDTADLVQDAFIKAFQSIHKFKGKSSFYTWLYRIAVNHTVTHLKKNRMRQFFSFENIQEEMSSSKVAEVLASRSQADKPTFLKELQEKLNESLQTLSIKHRTVVVLHEIEGLSHKEIAEVTKTSEGTVRSRLHYAKEQLQSQLRDYIK